MFSPKFIEDYHATWNAIAYDAAEAVDCEEPKDANEELEICIELTIDANRIAIYGSKESDNELKDKLSTTPYKEVVAYLAKNHPIGL